MPQKTSPDRERRYRAVLRRLSNPGKVPITITAACIAEGVSVQSYQAWAKRRRGAFDPEK